MWSNYHKFSTWKKRGLDYKARDITFPAALLMGTILLFSDREQQAVAFFQVQNRK